MALKLTMPSMEVRLVSREISGSTVKTLGCRGAGAGAPRAGAIELARFGVGGLDLYLLLPLREVAVPGRGMGSAVSPRACSLAGRSK